MSIINGLKISWSVLILILLLLILFSNSKSEDYNSNLYKEKTLYRLRVLTFGVSFVRVVEDCGEFIKIYDYASKKEAYLRKSAITSITVYKDEEKLKKEMNINLLKYR